MPDVDVYTEAVVISICIKQINSPEMSLYLKPKKKYPFRVEPTHIGHYVEYPPG